MMPAMNDGFYGASSAFQGNFYQPIDLVSNDPWAATMGGMPSFEVFCRTVLEWQQSLPSANPTHLVRSKSVRRGKFPQASIKAIAGPQPRRVAPSKKRKAATEVIDNDLIEEQSVASHLFFDGRDSDTMDDSASTDVQVVPLGIFKPPLSLFYKSPESDPSVVVDPTPVLAEAPSTESQDQRLNNLSARIDSVLTNTEMGFPQW